MLSLNSTRPMQSAQTEYGEIVPVLIMVFFSIFFFCLISYAELNIETRQKSNPMRNLIKCTHHHSSNNISKWMCLQKMLNVPLSLSIFFDSHFFFFGNIMNIRLWLIETRIIFNLSIGPNSMIIEYKFQTTKISIWWDCMGLFIFFYCVYVCRWMS